ncbi:MAG TPA: hypothetical protein VJ725_02285 [Thermoanaerobaculia bacterium]|nr:hypothetical protein [Thermoanaerobaculia bacterium]
MQPERVFEAPTPSYETPELPESPAAEAPAWGLGTKVLFRFAAVYFLLYFLPWCLNLIPYSQGVTRPVADFSSELVTSVGERVFGVHAESEMTGSGDTTWDYVRVFFLLVTAAAATVVWSILDRKRPHYARLYAWLRVYVRVSLATAMIVYGGMKAINSQFPSPSLDSLSRTFGDSSPMRLLWTFMGFSQPYTMFSGIAELAGGLLLAFRRTALLGALVSIGVMANVVMLNFCYDVPVKLFSSHLLLAGVFLLLPDLARLANLFVLNRRVQPAPLPPLFANRRLDRAVVAVRTLFFLGLAGYMLYSSRQMRMQFEASRSPLRGIWKVEEFVLDGQVRPPLTTDPVRWRRVIFDYPQRATIQPMDAPGRYYMIKLDPRKRSLELTGRDDPKTKSTLTYERPKPDVLLLTGAFEGKPVRARLLREEETKLPLTSRGFHWINEYPYNR